MKVSGDCKLKADLKINFHFQIGFYFAPPVQRKIISFVQEHFYSYRTNFELTTGRIFL